MEYIEDYDEECIQLVKTIERFFKEWKNCAQADKAGHLESIRARI